MSFVFNPATPQVAQPRMPVLHRDEDEERMEELRRDVVRNRKLKSGAARGGKSREAVGWAVGDDGERVAGVAAAEEEDEDEGDDYYTVPLASKREIDAKMATWLKVGLLVCAALLVGVVAVGAVVFPDLAGDHRAAVREGPRVRSVVTLDAAASGMHGVDDLDDWAERTARRLHISTNAFLVSSVLEWDDEVSMTVDIFDTPAQSAVDSTMLLQDLAARPDSRLGLRHVAEAKVGDAAGDATRAAE